MQEKRYQVFISSTFNDLREARRAVQDVLISIGDFPVQMEDFPAADEDQFDFIKSLIDKCDYYVLIIAGRYGTLDKDGISYTEKEYRYAVSKGVPVLVMLHNDRQNISKKDFEETEEGIKKLDNFIDTVSQGRLRKGWSTKDGLKLAVREALEYAKATKPRVGWVRGDSIASLDALEELNAIRKENEQFRNTIGKLNIDMPLPDVPHPSEQIALTIEEVGGGYQSSGGNVKVQGSWIDFFPLFFSNLSWGTSDWNDEFFWHANDDDSCVNIGSAIASEISGSTSHNKYRITKNMLELLSGYYEETGFLLPPEAGDAFSQTAKQYARRYRIASAIDSTSALSLVEGKISEKSASPSPFDTDDEIPF